MEERGRTGRKEGVVFAGPHSSPPVFSFFLPFLPVSAASLGPQAPRLLVGSGMALGSQSAFGSGPWDRSEEKVAKLPPGVDLWKTFSYQNDSFAI